MTTKKRLLNVKGISEAKVDKIKEATTKICVSIHLQTMFLMLQNAKIFAFQEMALAHLLKMKSSHHFQALRAIFNIFFTF